MHYMSGLPYGEFPYEERFLTSNELEQKALMPGALELYWEVLVTSTSAYGRHLLHQVGKVSYH